ncbi:MULTISPECIES: DUF4172 domain-containing protein [Agrobacterium]|uniref:DUF4172 domain-containing protein n=2 Tax=Agrobacterium tumefaciens TaxID=358 RepID=UPI00396A5366
MAGQGFKTNLRPNFTASAMWTDRMGQTPVLRNGEVIGAVRHFNEDNSKQRCIELLGDETVKTSQVEGEFMDRVSVQSSLRRSFVR